MKKKVWHIYIVIVSITIIALLVYILYKMNFSEKLVTDKKSYESELLNSNESHKKEDTKKLQEKVIKDYLLFNSSFIDLSDDAFNSLKQYKLGLQNYDVFLCGEQHAIANNYELQLYLLKYFNKEYNVNYLLIEAGYALSQLINMYLNTGDESFLKEIFSELEGTLGYTSESYYFWVQLYKYNCSLPKDKKIIVIGVDIEHQTMVAFKYIHEILQKEKAPKKIEDKINILKNYYDNRNAINGLFLGELINDVQNLEEEYKTYLKGDFFNFKLTVNNLYNTQQCYNSSNNYRELREKCIKENFREIYEYIPTGKYFGQFGLAHTMLATPNGETSKFATFLSSEYAPTKFKVASIRYFYKECYALKSDIDNANQYTVSKVNESVGINLLSSIATTNYTLFKFDSNGSPFKSFDYFAYTNMNGTTDGYTTDYYQYGILIVNSPAAHSYREYD